MKTTGSKPAPEGGSVQGDKIRVGHTKMNEPKLKLTFKPCGDCWLHIDAPSGLKASINLGQRGGMNDQTIVGRAIREVAAIHEEKPIIPEPNEKVSQDADRKDDDAKYANRNCNNCVHRDGVICVLTGYHWTIQRQYPEAPCDINLSGWQPLLPKKPLMQRLRELWDSWHTDQVHRHGGENSPIWERDPKLK